MKIYLVDDEEAKSQTIADHVRDRFEYLSLSSANSLSNDSFNSYENIMCI